MARRKDSLGGNCLSILAMLTFMIVMSQPASADYAYFNDFEGDPATWTEWTFLTPSLEPAKQATTPSGRHFLGRDPVYGFGNVTAALTLPAVPAGFWVTVNFELFIILTWDGNNNGGPPWDPVGPDFWKLSSGDGQVLLNTTFYSAPDGRQSYPDNYYSDHPGAMGSSVGPSLGYDPTGWGGLVFNIEKSFYTSGGDVVIKFQGYNLQVPPDPPPGVQHDESWGLDNVLVSVNNCPLPPVPVPGTLILFGSGLLLLTGLTKRSR